MYQDFLKKQRQKKLMQKIPRYQVYQMLKTIVEAIEETSEKKQNSTGNIVKNLTEWINQNQSLISENISKGFNPMTLPKNINPVIGTLTVVDKADIAQSVNAKLPNIFIAFHDGAFSRSMGMNSTLIEFIKK